MNEQMQPTTEQVHGNLQGILLNGRIMVNGLPLTANEIAVVIQGEKMLFEKAMKFDQAAAFAATAKKRIKEEAEAKQRVEEQASDTAKLPVKLSK